MSHSPRLFGSEANKPSSRADAEVLDRWARATDTELGSRDIEHLDKRQRLGIHERKHKTKFIEICGKS